MCDPKPIDTAPALPMSQEPPGRHGPLKRAELMSVLAVGRLFRCTCDTTRQPCSAQQCSLGDKRLDLPTFVSDQTLVSSEKVGPHSVEPLHRFRQGWVKRTILVIEHTRNW